jgi:hypothetical protein
MKCPLFLLFLLGMMLLPPMYLPAQSTNRHFFEDGITRRLFKCRLELAGQPISGVLLVKQLGDFSYRAVYTAETGFTFFDVGMADDATVFHVAVGPFKKKIIQRAIAQALQSALLRPMKISFEKEVQSTVNYTGLRYVLKTDYSDAFPVRVDLFKGKRLQSSADFYFTHSRKQVPDSIYVPRTGFPLTMSFRLLNQ